MTLEDLEKRVEALEEAWKKTPSLGGVLSLDEQVKKLEERVAALERSSANG